jgi:hypothetical protein
MPALANPRHEAFAFAIFQGLSGETRKVRAQSTTYRIAYPNCAEGHSAEVAASRLLRRVEPIMARVRELQAESNARLQPKIDFSRERVGRRLHRASEIAEADRNASAMATSELGIAKVFGHFDQANQNQSESFADAKSMRDVGVILLRQVGLSSPSDREIQEAIEAHDALIEALQAIAERAQALSIAHQP